MKYSLQEALKELHNPKKNLKESKSMLKESNDDIVTAVFKDNGFDKSEFEEAYPELMSRLEFDTTDFDNREHQLAYCNIYVKGKRADVEEFIQISIWDYGCDTKEEAEELYGEGCIPTIIENESLKESNDDVNNLSPEEVVTKYIFEPMGIEEKDSEHLEQTDDDGYTYENIVHYLSEEDWQKLFNEFSDVEGDTKLRTLLPENIGDYELEPYWELDRGTYILDRPAVAFYNCYIGEFEDEDSEEYEESLTEAAQFVTAATILKKEQSKIFAQTTEDGMRKTVLSILEKNKDKMKPENYNTVVRTITNCPKRAVPSTIWTMLNPSQKVGKK